MKKNDNWLIDWLTYSFIHLFIHSLCCCWLFGQLTTQRKKKWIFLFCPQNKNQKCNEPIKELMNGQQQQYVQGNKKKQTNKQTMKWKQLNTTKKPKKNDKK